MKHLIKSAMKTIIVGMSLCSVATISQAKEEISMITSKKEIWNQTPDDVKQRFGGFKWEDLNNGCKVLPKDGLTFWGGDIISFSVMGDSSINVLDLKVYEAGKSVALDQATFLKLASSWKKKFEDKTGARGRALAKITHNGKDIQAIVWEYNDAVVILMAEWAKAPESLAVKIYSKNEGAKQLSIMNSGNF